MLLTSNTQARAKPLSLRHAVQAIFPCPIRNTKKLGPKVVIEAMLDLTLIAGFLAAIGLLVIMTIRFVFSP
jgi:hypothetical protein